MGEKKQTIAYLNILNVLACICVVGMHVNGAVHTAEIGSSVWAQSLIVETLAYWAVPVFFMLSGVTLMHYRERYGTKEFFKKRWQKVGIPFIFWTAFTAVYRFTLGKLEWGGVKKLIDMILNSEIDDTYWFFIPLFMVYLSMPVLSKLADDQKLLRYMAGVSVVTLSVLPLLCNVFGLRYNYNLQFPVLCGFAIYPVLGYLLHTTEFTRPQRCILYALGILGFAVRYGHTYFASVQSGTLEKLTWGYTNLPVLLSASAMFVFIKYASKSRFLSSARADKIFRTLSSASFGIYLIHVLVLGRLVAWLHIDMSAAWWRWLGTILVFALSFLAVKIMQKIPVLRRVVPK